MNEKDLFRVAQEALDGYKNFIDFLKKEKTCRETQRLDTIDEMEVEINHGVEIIACLRHEVKRLKDSIERHRRDVWGDGVVEHGDDVTLYEVLK